jgi:hypothetical protein
VTPAEAAAMLGLSLKTVQTYAQHGKYGIQRVQGGKITRASIAIAIEERRKAKEYIASTKRTWAEQGNCGRCQIIFNQEGYPDTDKQPDGLCLHCHEAKHAQATKNA